MGDDLVERHRLRAIFTTGSSWSSTAASGAAPGLAAARRLSWKACVFILIETPLTSIACSIAFADSGNSPFW